MSDLWNRAGRCRGRRAAAGGTLHANKNIHASALGIAVSMLAVTAAAALAYYHYRSSRMR